MKKLFVILLGLAACTVHSDPNRKERSTSYVDQKCRSSEPCRIPVSTLMANVDKMIGKPVELSGFLVEVTGDYYIYGSKELAEADYFNTGIRVDGVFDLGELKERGGSNAVVTGVVQKSIGQGWTSRGWAIVLVSKQPQLFERISYGKKPKPTLARPAAVDPTR